MRSRSRLSSTSKSSEMVSSMRVVVLSVDGDVGSVIFEDMLEEEAILLEEVDGVLEEGDEFWIFFSEGSEEE
jgi:hypothetical protein